MVLCCMIIHLHFSNFIASVLRGLYCHFNSSMHCHFTFLCLLTACIVILHLQDRVLPFDSSSMHCHYRSVEQTIWWPVSADEARVAYSGLPPIGPSGAASAGHHSGHQSAGHQEENKPTHPGQWATTGRPEETALVRSS